MSCRRLTPVDANAVGTDKVIGTEEPTCSHGPLVVEAVVPGDGGNDAVTSCVVGAGAVTGNVRDEVSNVVDHAIVLADDDGTVKVPVYSGATRWGGVRVGGNGSRRGKP